MLPKSEREVHLHTLAYHVLWVILSCGQVWETLTYTFAQTILEPKLCELSLNSDQSRMKVQSKWFKNGFLNVYTITAYLS